MKVTDIKTFAVDCFRTNWVFVKVTQMKGLTVLAKLHLNTRKNLLSVQLNI